MSKKKNNRNEPVVEEAVQVTESSTTETEVAETKDVQVPTITQEVVVETPVLEEVAIQALSEDDKYKLENKIPMDALLARKRSDLPRYFRQGPNVFFTHALPANTAFDTPIWFQVISNPFDVEIMEALYVARMAAVSKGLNISN